MNSIDPIEFVKKCLRIELLECQKTMLRTAVEQKEIYICFPRHCGYSEYKERLEEEDTNNDGNN